MQKRYMNCNKPRLVSFATIMGVNAICLFFFFTFSFSQNKYRLKSEHRFVSETFQTKTFQMKLIENCFREKPALCCLSDHELFSTVLFL